MRSDDPGVSAVLMQPVRFNEYHRGGGIELARRAE
jgi:hypothetical protein